MTAPRAIPGPLRPGSAGPAPDAPGPDAPAIRVERLGRRFDDLWAVRDMTFEVRRGEVLGLLGPNGAGKTTTVRMLTGLIAPTEGDAWLDGLDLRHDADAIRERVGILTETPGLYEKLSAARNLDFFGRLHGMARDLRAARIEELLRLFDLWERRDEPAGTFSKGMKQKLAIARALLHEPLVVFLDEPTAALDPEAAFIVREAIEALRGAGRTILLATHNLDEAGRLCDRIAFVRGGLVRIDSPARLRGQVGGRGIEVRLGGPADDAQLGALRQVPGVHDVEALDHRLTVGLDDPPRATPDVVRALVAGGADILEVRERAASLEDVYFEVMGVRASEEGAAT